ncbi:MAG TPA: Hsp70 family protein [Methylomirabilota bacterium]|nr:Hsp70 family protein [Methylomirabilota bacterium]
MSRVIGIDLGMKKVRAAVVGDGRPIVLPNAEGENSTPAIVAVTPEGQWRVGTKAHRQRLMNLPGTFLSLKRFLGRSYEDVAPEEIQRIPFQLLRGPHDAVRIDAYAHHYTPEECVALLLSHVCEDAARLLGQRVHEAIIAVPASFTHVQRQAVRDAGTIAGLHVRRLINEPTAAALLYTMETTPNATVMVVNWGSGACEISLLDIGSGVCEVRASVGDLRLGGDECDSRVVDYAVEFVLRQHGIDVRADRRLLLMLREAAEQAKCELSSVMQTALQLPHFGFDSSGPFHLNVPLTRADFAALVAPLVQRCALLIEQAFSDAKMSPADVDTVLLVGGAVRMPLVKDLLTKIMGGRTPIVRVLPEEAVAEGAALLAGMDSGIVERVLVFDVMPLALSIGTSDVNVRPLIERHTPLPCRATTFVSSGEGAPSVLRLPLYQGEQGTAAGIQQVGEVVIKGVPLLPQGVSRIAVICELDESGLLTVQAQDEETGAQLSATIDDTGNLPREEVERLRGEVMARSVSPER